jgi:hypothetical protein
VGLDNLKNVVRFQAGTKLFSSPEVLDRIWGPFRSLFSEYQELFPAGRLFVAMEVIISDVRNE